MAESGRDYIPIRLPSGGRARIDLPRPFTVADATHLVSFLTMYIEDETYPTLAEDLADPQTEHLPSGPGRHG